MKRWEVIFANQFNKVLKAEVNSIISVLKAEGPQQAIKKAEHIIIIEGLGAVLRRLYVFVGIASGKRVLKDIKQSAKVVEKKAGFGFDEIWTNLILQYFRLYLLNKAVIPISKTIRELILEVLHDGIIDGWSIDKMAGMMTDPEFTMTRARLVARTEIAKAQFYGEELGIENSEWETEQMWISAHDHRVRSSHRKVDGESIPEGGKWKVDRIRGGVVIGYDMMRGPGDPEAHIENLANCRCVRSAVAKRDERGRLILKRKKELVLQ